MSGVGSLLPQKAGKLCELGLNVYQLSRHAKPNAAMVTPDPINAWFIVRFSLSFSYLCIAAIESSSAMWFAGRGFFRKVRSYRYGFP